MNKKYLTIFNTLNIAIRHNKKKILLKNNNVNLTTLNKLASFNLLTYFLINDNKIIKVHFNDDKFNTTIKPHLTLLSSITCQKSIKIHELKKLTLGSSNIFLIITSCGLKTNFESITDLAGGILFFKLNI